MIEKGWVTSSLRCPQCETTECKFVCASESLVWKCDKCQQQYPVYGSILLPLTEITFSNIYDQFDRYCTHVAWDQQCAHLSRGISPYNLMSKIDAIVAQKIYSKKLKGALRLRSAGLLIHYQNRNYVLSCNIGLLEEIDTGAYRLFLWTDDDKAFLIQTLDLLVDYEWSNDGKPSTIIYCSSQDAWLGYCDQWKCGATIPSGAQHINLMQQALMARTGYDYRESTIFEKETVGELACRDVCTLLYHPKCVIGVSFGKRAHSRIPLLLTLIIARTYLGRQEELIQLLLANEDQSTHKYAMYIQRLLQKQANRKAVKIACQQNKLYAFSFPPHIQNERPTPPRSDAWDGAINELLLIREKVRGIVHAKIYHKNPLAVQARMDAVAAFQTAHELPDKQRQEQPTPAPVACVEPLPPPLRPVRPHRVVSCRRPRVKVEVPGLRTLLPGLCTPGAAVSMVEAFWRAGNERSKALLRRVVSDQYFSSPFRGAVEVDIVAVPDSALYVLSLGHGELFRLFFCEAEDIVGLVLRYVAVSSMVRLSPGFRAVEFVDMEETLRNLQLFASVSFASSWPNSSLKECILETISEHKTEKTLCQDVLDAVYLAQAVKQMAEVEEEDEEYEGEEADLQEELFQEMYNVQLNNTPEKQDSEQQHVVAWPDSIPEGHEAIPAHLLLTAANALKDNVQNDFEAKMLELLPDEILSDDTLDRLQRVCGRR